VVIGLASASPGKAKTSQNICKAGEKALKFNVRASMSRPVFCGIQKQADPELLNFQERFT